MEEAFFTSKNEAFTPNIRYQSYRNEALKEASKAYLTSLFH